MEPPIADIYLSSESSLPVMSSFDLSTIGWLYRRRQILCASHLRCWRCISRNKKPFEQINLTRKSITKRRPSLPVRSRATFSVFLVFYSASGVNFILKLSRSMRTYLLTWTQSLTRKVPWF